jgi:CzcA family heavy metal efflux pump
MLNHLIRFSLTHRWFVIGTGTIAVAVGVMAVARLNIDVFPDLNRPLVTIFAEAPGLAPEEVEVLVVAPIEAAVNGAPDVERVRSVSSVGLALVYVDFRWGSDQYRNRQVIAERLQLAAHRLPDNVVPTLGPMTSVMGEIMLIGFTSDTTRTSPMELRSLVDWTIRPRLLSVPGVAQATAIGGEVKQFQVLLNPIDLARIGVSIVDVERAMSESSRNAAGGYLDVGRREFIIRNVGRVRDLDDLARSVVAWKSGVPILLRDVARLTFGGQPKRGDASVNARPAVILSVQKQPGADTVQLSARVERALADLKPALPSDVQIHGSLFRQATFITAAVRNIEEALRDGSLIVAIILFLFLLSIRTTIITLTAIPLSFLTAALVLWLFGASVNTMTLGGLAIAVGELVDDAIVDVENVFRRLRENRQCANPRPTLDVVLDASIEVRGSIVYATVIVLLAFLPLFFLDGLEGRMFVPLGAAYVVAVSASLLVSLTLTPVLASYLLPRAKATERATDSVVVRKLKLIDEYLLRFSLDHSWLVIGVAALILMLTASAIPLLGREFLPAFNESNLTVNVIGQPGTSLGESNRLGTEAEREILSIAGVQSTGRRTGRAELDEHAEGVNYSEIDAVLADSRGAGRAMMETVRSRLASLHGVELNVGQPIAHRLDHLLSGVEAQIAIKIFGADLSTLVAKSNEIRDKIAPIRGVVDLSVEKQTMIPQVQIAVNRAGAAQYGLRVGEVVGSLETALNGRVVSNVLEGQASYPVAVRLEDAYRDSIPALRTILVDAPDGSKVPLEAVADVRTALGPNQILRENGQRRIVVQCNVSGRDLGSVVSDIRKTISDTVRFGPGYFVTYGGQFESQQNATRLIAILSIMALVGIFVVLYAHFGSSLIALQIMLNIPLAIIGGVFAVIMSGGTMSVASLIGFVTLAGIASRNGIMMVSHYLHLMRHEGEQFSRQMIIRGSLERLVPVLMTAFATALALLPLAFSGGQAGKELLQPIAVVILGGLISSTVLDQAVTPAVFYHYGRKMFPCVDESLPGRGVPREGASVEMR